MDEFLDIIAPYNLWNGNNLPTGFSRIHYTQQLLRYTGNRLIKVLTGQRRVGKSFIMRQLAVELINKGVCAENILFINRELAVFDFIQNAADLSRLVAAFRKRFMQRGTIYVFVDEVQEIDSWERAVNSMAQDYTVDIEVFISGSNSKLLSGELASLISGRYVEFSVYPFSFGEFVQVHNLVADRSSFMRYIHEGGLPELINLNDIDLKQRYVAGLRDSIMLKDIVKRYAIKDVSLLENLFVYLVNNASSMVSVGGIVNYLKSKGSKTTYETVAAYISYLRDAYILHKSERYNIAGKELLAGNFKVYINDQAYHNYLFPTVKFGIGYLLEGIVFVELLRRGYSVKTGIIRNSEVDFVAINSTRTLYIQVAYILNDESTAEREYSALEKISGIGEKLLVTLDDEQYPVRNGIRHIQAWNLNEFI